MSAAVELQMGGYVYILASGVGGTLYVGVTSDPIARIHQHQLELSTASHANTGLIVYFEQRGDWTAILREKQINSQKWKVELIERHNPPWIDLHPRIATP